MSYTDISIDLETLGTAPGAVITQIGLCAFNQRPETSAQQATETTSILVDPQSAIDLGFTIDWSTISWWLQQDEAPRVQMAQQKGVPITKALFSAGDFIAGHAHGGDPRAIRVWGHGSDFDIALLGEAYRRCRLTVPWNFRLVRDLRTLAGLSAAMHVERPAPSVAHNAGDDATAQAEWIKKLTYQIERKDTRVIVEQPQG